MVKIREARNKLRATKRILAIATVTAVVIGAGMLWRISVSSRRPNQIAVVDVRAASPVRGNHQGHELPPITIPRDVGRLRIVMPVGSEGDYEAEILELRSSTQPLARSKGSATVEDHAVVLNMSVDLSHLESGPYALALRHDGTEWEYYPLILK